MDNYKYMDVSTPDTLEALIYYLGLPDDKIGIELRFRLAVQEQESQLADKERKKCIMSLNSLELIAKLDEDIANWQTE